MKVYIKSEKSQINATGDYSLEDHSLIVKKGSVLAVRLSESKSFKGINSVMKARDGVVSEGILQKDTHFTSPSTAANFVTGRSANGMVIWKTKNGKTLKAYLSEKGGNCNAE